MSLDALLTPELLDRLGWTLVHSLWQLAGVALLAGLALRACTRPAARYVVAAIGLFVMPLAVAGTFLSSAPRPPAGAPMLVMPRTTRTPAPVVTIASRAPDTATVVPAVPAASSPAGHLPIPAARISWPSPATPALRFAVAAWMAGVLLLSLRHAGGWLALQRLRTLRTAPVDPAIRALLARLQIRLRIAGRIAIARSLLVQTPMVVGHLRPLILLPACVLTGLSAAQLEAILAHELAHVRRSDYLVNLLQTLVETLLFYHPAAWWLSRILRAERELCCDDLAAVLCGDAALYADALLSLEELRTPPFAMAAAGNDARQLRHRIQRLLSLPQQPRPTPLAAVVVCLALLTLPWLSRAQSTAPGSLPARAPASAPWRPIAAPPAPPLPVGPISGKILMPDGTPAKDIVVVPNSVVDARGPVLIYLDATKTAADGTFTFKKAPAGASVDLFAITDDHTLAFSATVTTKPQAAAQNIGTFPLVPTLSADILIVDAHQKPRPNIDVNVQPTFYEEGLGNMTRKFTTDGQGRLKPDGLVAGLHYKLNRPGNGNYTNVVLVPVGNGPPLTQVTIDDPLTLQIVDANNKPRPVSDLTLITVTTDDKAIWRLGPKPAILDRLPDGSLLINREQLILAHQGNLVTVYFLDEQKLPTQATGAFPGKTGFVKVVAPLATARGYTLANPPRAVADKTIAGRVVDTAGKPIADAVFSVPDYSLPLTLGKTKRVTATDADGNFEISTAAIHYYYLQIDKPGYGRQWLLADDLPSGQAIDIQLDNAARLQFDLKRPDGSPAAGTTLTAVTSIERLSDDWPRVSDLTLTATAGADGRIDLPFSAHTWDLRLNDGDTLFARLPSVTIEQGKALQKVITLAPGVHLNIRTVDSATGKPVTGAKVTLQDHYPGIILTRKGSERTSDADGRVEWVSLMPGEQMFDCTAEGYARHFCDDQIGNDKRGIDSIYLPLAPGMHEVTVRLEKGVRLTGHVLDAAGKPLAKRYVNVGGLSTGDRRYMNVTNDKGEFSLLVPQDNGYQHSFYTVEVFNEPNDSQPLASSDAFDPEAGDHKTFEFHLP